MIFLTYWFVVFAALFFPVYWFTPHPSGRKLVLLSACAFFQFHFAGAAGVAPIVVLGVATYLAGLSRKRWVCNTVIVLCVASLVFYKYSLFLSQELLAIAVPNSVQWATKMTRSYVPETPPLAISFFTFEFVHYLYDVSHGDTPIRNFLDFSLFSAFWPSMVAGPVKRYQQFLPALAEGVKSVSASSVAAGAIRFGAGVGKKFMADNITGMLTFFAPVFDGLDRVSRWTFVGGLALRIYFDFSGYSDMAIGFARMAGIRLPENFAWPYFSRSMPEFWHRWHITLSTWIRDYVFFPLGGHRNPARRLVNALIAFALCGLWHGSGWNYIVWGVYHGVGVVLATSYQKLLGPAGPPVARLMSSSYLSWFVTMVYVSVGWLFFFYPVNQALHMIRVLVK